MNKHPKINFKIVKRLERWVGVSKLNIIRVDIHFDLGDEIGIIRS